MAGFCVEDKVAMLSLCGSGAGLILRRPDEGLEEIGAGVEALQAAMEKVEAEAVVVALGEVKLIDQDGLGISELLERLTARTPAVELCFTLAEPSMGALIHLVSGEPAFFSLLITTAGALSQKMSRALLVLQNLKRLRPDIPVVLRLEVDEAWQNRQIIDALIRGRAHHVDGLLIGGAISLSRLETFAEAALEMGYLVVVGEPRAAGEVLPLLEELGVS